MMKKMTMNNNYNEEMNSVGISMDDASRLLAMLARLSTGILNLPANRGCKPLADAALDCIDEMNEIIDRNGIIVAVLRDFDKPNDEAAAMDNSPAREERDSESTPTELADLIASDLSESMLNLNDSVIDLEEAITALKNMLERERNRHEK